jgi:thymidylate synthase
MPTMKINKNIDSIYNFEFEDFTLLNYESEANIKAPIAV